MRTVIRWSLEGMGFTCLFGAMVMVSIGFALGAADTYGPFVFFTGVLGMAGAGVGALSLSDRV